MKEKREPNTMATETKTTSKAQQAKALFEKANALIGEAREEQLAIINTAIEELRELGFHYVVTEASDAPKPAPRATKAPKTATKSASGYDASKSCQICGTAGHDGRAHRNQDPKKAFTPEELASRGLAQ